jgi:hypothetical protein
MAKRLHLRLHVDLALTGKVADQFRFLRVDADHGLAPSQIRRFDLAYVLELCVEIWMRAY